MKKRTKKLLFLCWCGGVSCAQAQIRPVQNVGPDRNFGYMVGDVITIQTIIEASADAAIDMRSLPVPGPLNAAIELRNIAVESKQKGQFRIIAEYQSFFAPDTVTDTELPGFNVQLTSGAMRETAHIPAWPFQVSPLRATQRTLADPSNLKPDPKIQPMAESGPLGRAGASLWFALLAFLAFASFRGWLPGPPGARRPFETAAHKLRKLGNPSEADGAAYQELHRAFDATAGHHIFADDVDAFIAAHPRFAACRPDIEAFFQSSTQLFFSPASRPKYFDVLRFAKSLRRQERRR